MTNSQHQITISTNASLEGWAGLLPKSNDRGTLGISGDKKKDQINVFGIEGSKVYNFNFFSFATQSSVNTHLHGSYRCLFIFGKTGRYSKQISDCFEQGNMGLIFGQRGKKFLHNIPQG